MDNLSDLIQKICNRKTLPNSNKFFKTLCKVNSVLTSEDISLRPRDKYGIGGGVINLNKNIKTIIVPDLHARVDFIQNLLAYKINNSNVLELLIKGEIQVVCVGDGFHSEGMARERWLLALQEFSDGYKKHLNMDEEMVLNLNLMEVIFLLKTSFPDHFHFLKGNHENILNENTQGNRPFYKFANEGEMVKTYMNKFFSQELVNELYGFEKKLPILAIGKNFLISHSEPRHFHPKKDVINYYLNTNIIYDFTWTNNGDADPDSVTTMLQYYLPENYLESKYFAGHRPVKELYNLRANGQFVQFHNPGKQIVVILDPLENINLEADIKEIGNV